MNQKQEENQNDQEEVFEIGPFSSMVKAVRTGSQVLVSCWNNKKILGTLKAFDWHFNMVLENVCETWIATQNKKKIQKEKYYGKLFLRGDSVVIVVPSLDAF